MRLKMAVVIISILLLNGCLMRTYPKTVERVDLEIRGQGNQGYLYGTAPVDTKEPQKTTRTIQVLEIELGKPLEILKEEPQDISKVDSQSLFQISSIETLPQSDEVSTMVVEETIDTSSEGLTDTYVVKPNDTLEKISARPEIYGTYKKWRKIYEANKDKLSSPSKIYPGQVLKIPRD